MWETTWADFCLQQYSETDIITEMAVCQSEVIMEEITMAMTKDNVEMIHGYLEAITDIHLEELTYKIF